MSNFIPHVTAATLVENNGRFLLVQEEKNGRLVLNQPAGHVEAYESLTQAAIRETLEDYLAGRRLPLEAIYQHPGPSQPN